VTEATAPSRERESTGDRASAIRLAMLMGGYRLARAVYVVAELRVADALAERPLTCAEIASRASADAGCLARVLRALAAFGFVFEDDAGRFSLTPLGSTLRADAAESLLPAALAMGSDWHWRLWGKLLWSVRTGRPAWDELDGRPFDCACKVDPEFARAVGAGRAALYATADEAFLDAYDLSPYPVLVEVAIEGGHGALLARALVRYAGATGVLQDLPVGAAEARQRLRHAGLDGRCRFVGGDCREAVTVTGDVFLLRGVLHNLADDAAVDVLRHCRDALPEGGRLLVVEMIVPEGNDFSVAKLVDLESLLLTAGGRERTEAELRAIVEAAGLDVLGVLGTASPASVIDTKR
jgi:O-methyltransferase domain/Dimerisation domain